MGKIWALADVKIWIGLALTMIVFLAMIGVLGSAYLGQRDIIAQKQEIIDRLNIDLTTCRNAAREREGYEGTARTDAERRCLDAVRDAYDAGRRVQQDLRAAADSGRYVPGQRNGGSD